MKYSLVVTEDAQSELEKIADYISESLCNPIAAVNFLDKVKSYYTTLSENPLIYQVCENIGSGDKEYRKVVINNYLLIYRVDESTKTVYVLHFFYGRRDYFDIV